MVVRFLVLVCIVSPVVAKNLSFTVVAEYSHDSRLYTQGLEFKDDTLYESSGLYGKSKLIRYKKNNVAESQIVRGIPSRYFAEGITVVQDTIYMLTWKQKTLLQYQVGTLKVKPQQQFYSGQGWGLTFFNGHFYRSDGSHKIWRHSLDDFTQLGWLAVIYQQRLVRLLNELEVVGLKEKQWLAANQYHSNFIYLIDPISGVATYKLDITSLKKKQPPTAEVANGLAWHKQRQALFITGKYWDKIYEIKLIL